MSGLRDADLVVLILIAESPGINGYEIRQRVRQRGLDAWAGVGPSSIYNGVCRITELGLVTSRPDIANQRKGPTGAALTLSKEGDRVVCRDLVATLAATREHDPRFNIALAGTDFLDTSVVVASLHKRADFLSAEHDRLSATRHDRPGWGATLESSGEYSYDLEFASMADFAGAVETAFTGQALS